MLRSKMSLFYQEMSKHITILGVGNILLTDEGLGVHVIERLSQKFSFPANVELFDGGTGGMSLLSVIEETDFLIVIDAVLINELPGTIVKFDFENLPSTLTRRLSAHDIDFIDVLNTAEALGKRPPTVIIGVQPKDISTYGTKLTIEKCIPKVIELILAELKRLGIEATPKDH